ncbi:heparinase II/III domain-containing protein [Pseudonocardia humida]|uniref:Heparinase II/III family protein n=1 Tax=Pseudonocardia humida TaxID=2800819 RepID=A0ABT0ZT43_9PSEU|nr:heparinase II/III family protein [Pseudonocardia humida]MCO1653880.1 heparinase II/III family protein [Pseudonocardia humida]
MSRTASIRADLAALGVLAPVRAFYELGKRSGAHGLALRAATRSARPAVLRLVPGFRPSGRVAPAAAGRCIADARQIVELGHRVFGQRIPVRAAEDWNLVGDHGARWPSPFWWQIDIRTEKRLGDVKWAWELGRHRDIVVLARAAFLQPGEQWEGELARRLRLWFRATPTEHGVHWYSNLEIALRAVAWMQVHALCADVLPQDVRDSMALDVARARRHLLVDFPYTVSSMRNNHLLGDALGLLAIQRFTGGSARSRLSRIAERAFAAQLDRHMRPDGSMIEDSVSYHRFVLEMLTVKHLLGDGSPAVVTAMGGAARHLRRMGALDGPIPQWGDWDEGRVLASSGDALDLAGSTALGLVLSGRSADPRWWSEFDEVAWYAPPIGDVGATTSAARPPEAAVVVSGGIARATVGDWDVWLKGGTGPSHQHADLTHVSARFGDRWVLVDPGTGTYNGRLDVRNAFRTSRAHNGLRTRGEEMFVPHRAFRWLTSATVHCGVPVRTRGAVVVWAVHDAYARSEGAGRIARAVVVTADGLTVVDWREDGQDALLTVALAPGTEIVRNELHLAHCPGLVVRGLQGGSAVEGQEQPFAGWHSTTYGQREPATWLERSVSGTAATVWGVARRWSTAHDATVDGDQVTVAGIEMGMEFRPGGASMVVRVGGRTRIHTAGTGAA